MKFTKDDVLSSINIALTDELLHRINMGEADVYHDVNADCVRVSTDLDGDPSRYVVTAHPLGNSDPSWLAGNWIQTVSGRKFDLADPRAEDVSIEDIAHALAHLGRFTGHTRRFYSVAQHSVLVRDILAAAGCPVHVQYAGLLHDATEAYVGDVSSPLKAMLPQFKVIEGDVRAAIEEALDIKASPREGDLVRYADLVALFIERDNLLPEPPEAWADEAVYAEGAREHAHLMPADHPPADSKAIFLAIFRDLRRKMGKEAWID